jgi:hypothetical protein
MTERILRPVLLAAIGLAFASASLARDMRHPATGEPAFTFTFPDDWAAQTIENGTMLSIVSPDHRVGFTLGIAAANGDSLDEIAKSAVDDTKGTLLKTKEASLSSYQGATYVWTYVNPHGNKLRVTMIMVKVGAIVASCGKLEIVTNSAPQQELADTIMKSVKITPSAKGSK